MSSTQGNTPINVSNQSIQRCSVTCNFNYDYGLSNLLTNTYTNYIKLSFNSPSSKVEFQDEYYQVNEVRLYSPSLNTYYGKHLDAELIIHHINSDSNLLVCIPIQSNTNTSTSSTLFHSIIPHLGQIGQPTSINVSNYTLNSFIPKSSYYIYTNANLPYDSYNGSYTMIIFDTKSITYSTPSGKITVDNAPIHMDTSDLKVLQKLIQPVSSSVQIRTPLQNNLYYNVEGTYANDITSDDIYIDCRPTGSDGMMDPTPNILTSGLNSSNINVSSNSTTELGNTLHSAFNTETKSQSNTTPNTSNGEIIVGSTIGVVLVSIGVFSIYKLFTK